MIEVAAPVPETQAQQPPATAEPTHEDMVALVRTNQEKDFDRHDRDERMRVLIRKASCGHAGNNPLFGAYNPSLEYSLAELRVLVPLERDRLNYSFEPTKPGGTAGKVAENRHGLCAVPHAGGRRKPHMNHKQQAIKSAAVRMFRKLVDEMSVSLRATCAEQEIEYLGIPDAMIPELGAKASRIAVREVTAQRKAHSRNKRRRQEHSRKANAGLLSTSTQEAQYVNRGGKYGR